MACNNCGTGSQTGGTYAKCPDGNFPTYQYVLTNPETDELVIKIGPYDHATALLELHKFLNPPLLPATPISYNVVQVKFCGNEEISSSGNFPLTCGGNGTGGPGTGCRSDEVFCSPTAECINGAECDILHYNQSTCQCCEDDYVYCIATETCIPVTDIGCPLQVWNQLTCECCPPDTVFCSVTGQCIPLGDCVIVAYNPIECQCCPPNQVFCVDSGTCVPLECNYGSFNPLTCECCDNGSVYCGITGECIPIPGCTLDQWNPLTCECCPAGTLFNGSNCQTECDPQQYTNITVNWEFLANGGGIQINSVVAGDTGQYAATGFTAIFYPQSNQGVPPLTVQYPAPPLEPNEPPQTLPIEIPLLPGDYTVLVYNVSFGECITANTANFSITGVKPLDCCEQIKFEKGGYEVAFFEVELDVPALNPNGYVAYVDFWNLQKADRISVYLKDGAIFREVAQSPFVGLQDLPTSVYPGIAWAKGGERGYWRNSNFIGSLTAPYLYAQASGTPGGNHYPNSDFGWNGAQNYLTPANRGLFNGATIPANHAYAWVNTPFAPNVYGLGRLFYRIPPNTPQGQYQVRIRVEGGTQGTKWRMVASCIVDDDCKSCGGLMPIPDECCPNETIRISNDWETQTLVNGDAVNNNFLVMSNAPSGRFTFTLLSGALPPGLALTPYVSANNQDGLNVSGTPTQDGTFTFVIEATNTETGCKYVSPILLWTVQTS